MLKLKDIDAAAQYALAQKTPVRVYEDDSIQAPRIKLAREMVARELERMRTEIGHQRRQIIELGCGTADISGWFSMGHVVVGFEAAPEALVVAARRWPWMVLLNADIQSATQVMADGPGESEEITLPVPCDILILCEILEHVVDPLALCACWIPHAKACLISSPLQGDRGGDLSGGEHLWSFERTDFGEFAAAGGHEIAEEQCLPMGSYTIRMQLSRRKPQAADIASLDAPTVA